MNSPMNPEEGRKKILNCLFTIAPEAADQTLDEKKPLRDQVDLDSVDFLKFMVQLSKSFSVEISEADYLKMTTLESCLTFLLSVPPPRNQSPMDLP